MIHVTFPDGAERAYRARRLRPRHRQIHLPLSRQAHGRDGARRRTRRSRRSDRTTTRALEFISPRRPARAGAHPPRRGACAGRSGAVAVAGHAGDDRPGDRERLLLRLLPQRAVHARGFPGDREAHARDHRARQAVHQDGRSRATRPRASSRRRARRSRSSSSTPFPPDQEVKLYSQGEWTDLCRGPHMTSTGKVGDAFKLMKVAGRLLARRFDQADAVAHLRDRVREEG